MKTLVTIVTLRRMESACFLKEKLESEKINCLFLHLGRVADKTDCIKVQVDAENVEKAIWIMMEIRDEYGKEIEDIQSTRVVRKIVVPTDFSKDSEEACQYAVHLANMLQAEIKLLHVFKNPVSEVKMQSNETYEHYINELAREEERRAKEEMVAFTNRIRKYIADLGIEGVFIHCVLAMGNIVEIMKEISRNYHPDLIVVGTKGRREGTSSVFSGTARELVTELGIPLLAIPGPRPLDDFEKLKVIYATDFNENDHTSLNRLLLIMESFNKQITCIHIDTEHNPASEDRMDELNGYLEREYVQHDIQCRLIDDQEVSQGIKDFAASTGANMLSFTIQKHSIFEKLFKPNLFKKILQEASLPILIFPS